MRFVDLAIDVAALLNASRSVAAKHLALRSRQLDAYRKTSPVTTTWRDDKPCESFAQSRSEANRQPENTADDEFVDTVDTNSKQSAAASHRPPPSTAAPTQHNDRKDGSSRGSVAASLYAQASQQRQEALRAVAAQRDVPDDVDINIFNTTHGATVLSSLRKQNITVSKKQQSSRPAKEHPLRYWPNPPPVTPEAETPPSTKPEPTHDRIATASTPPLTGTKLPTNSTGPTQNSTPQSELDPKKIDEEVVGLAKDIAVAENPSAPAYALRESKVPASRFSRLWNYGGLAAGMLGGAMTESVSRAFGGGGQGSVLLSGNNMERMVAKLSRMRGAALKLGQMMSFQDSKMLPAPIQEVLQRVQDRADYMPAWQRDRVLTDNFGKNWRDLFSDFEETPIAAASIGQVHKATLKSNGKKVAVKIQFPGVADSINSDLDNLGILLNATKLLPKGLYLNKTIDNARLELGWECDYEREAQCAIRYRELLQGEQDVFLIPSVHLEACGKQVLTMDFMDGVGVTRVTSFTQEQRDWIGTQIMRLCLQEITKFKFMQTDPNWTNFLYDAEQNKLVLLDFGASRDYHEDFVRQYVQLLDAACRSDRTAVKELSESLGYLTGHESRTMLEAHTQSVLTLAEPFANSAPDVYDFKDQTITERVKALIPIMLRERLAPPPEETYSLHRKLSGAFLLCARLGSKVPCKDMFKDSVRRSGYVS
ncbi:hypothetical protein QQS21_004529 [Conoideocrella luteorostrata]|uniref:ABC1 atypical kinase-like domain-containing protein n=1 Tax=Conoideocrella luteorostrata TaxID=1105319 RepID=A0AAJ0CR78_9HYPO|nr:hypothetical protein QQS21_004529 [Conoideocrella luteorostrata]